MHVLSHCALLQTKSSPPRQQFAEKKHSEVFDRTCAAVDKQLGWHLLAEKPSSTPDPQDRRTDPDPLRPTATVGVDRGRALKPWVQSKL